MMRIFCILQVAGINTPFFNSHCVRERESFCFETFGVLGAEDLKTVKEGRDAFFG